MKRLGLGDFKEHFSLRTFRSNMAGEYNASSIQTLSGLEHIRKRPGMYIGRLGDGSHPDDGIYVLLKEVVDNSIDEFIMGAGKRVEISIADDGTVSVRDYGRGIPHGIGCRIRYVPRFRSKGGTFPPSRLAPLSA